MVRWSTATRMFVAWGLTLPAAALVASGAELVMRTGDVGVAAVAVFLVASCVAIWVISRRQVVDHTNVNEIDAASTGAGDEQPGVVTTAIAAVAVPPTAGTTAAVTDEDLKATIPAATANPATPAAPAAAV